MLFDDSSVDIWNIDINQENYNKCLKLISFLSTREKETANSFKFEKDIIRFVISHVVMRLLIGSYTRLNPEELIFNYNLYGKPSISIDKKINFNLSHSHNKSVISFYKDEIGIDIEYINELTEIDELTELVLSKQEQLILEELSGDRKIRKFFDLWTKKEALIKAGGLGISDNIKNIDLYSLEPIDYIITSFYTFDDNYVGNLVYKSRTPARLRYYNWK